MRGFRVVFPSDIFDETRVDVVVGGEVAHGGQDF